MSKQKVLPRSFFPALLACAAVGMLACAILLGGAGNGTEEPAELAAASSKLGKMQREVQEQLVEAAKRRASASKHKTQAVLLQAKSEEDFQRAMLLHKQASLAHREAQLKHSADDLAKARLSVKHLREKASELDATADRDRARADKDKEEILELEDKAGTYSERAGEESDKIAVVESAQRKTARELPSLLSDAESDEKNARELKAEAARHMRDSSVKSSKASQLDHLAREKEAQAKTMRQRLMAVLQQKATTLEEKQENAAREEQEAKFSARKAAAQAEALAGSAEQQAALARSAQAVANQRLLTERAAQELVGTKHELLHAAAQAKRTRMHGEEEELSQQPTRKEIDDRRASNLAHAGAHAAALRVMRGRVASDDGEGGQTGIEDEDGHLQLQAGSARSSLKEDGHYSEREEAFKAALASAYRNGYKQQLAEEDSPPRAKRHTALTSEKPARMQMLGDTEMLQKGQGETVSLERESQEGAGSPFPMLWEDGSSLGSETRRLEGSTRRLRRMAPESRQERPVAHNLQELYEDGHTSREEEAFNKEMNQYRGALQGERQAALAKAQRATQELSQLPGGRGRVWGVQKFDDRRQADLHSQMHRAQNVMLAQPRDHWEVPNRHGGEVHVREDEEGHLVLEHRGEGDSEELRGDSREDSLSSVRGSKLRRIEEELHDSRRRDRRLEARTERLQGEVDALSGRGRTEDLYQGRSVERRDGLRHGDDRSGDSRDRRHDSRREISRRGEGREPRREERQPREKSGQRGERHPAVGQERNFSPDSTYEKEYAKDPGHVSIAEIKFQHALKSFDRTKDILRQGAIEDQQHMHLPELVPAHLPGQGL